MIVIENINGAPARKLTPVEEKTVTKVKSDGVNFTYYQGDEPKTEPSLSQLKEAKVTEIDSETESNIVAGFEFDGKVFSMSVNAQINWTNFPNIKDDKFPVPIMTKADELYLLKLEDRENFYDTVLNHKYACLQAGNVKKQSVMNCKTIEELNQL